MDTTRILLCDDHAVVRAGLAAIFEYEDDLEVVGQASDGREAVRKAVELSPDVVIMDLMMPQLNGATATAEVIAKVPGTKVLVLTSFALLDEVRSALMAGAAGVLQKTVSNECLVESIRNVKMGRRVLAPEFAIATRVVDENATDLTMRQLEVLHLLTKGFTNREIAQHLDISVNGVKRHLEHLFERLGVSTRAEAVAVAFREQLLNI